MVGWNHSQQKKGLQKSGEQKSFEEIFAGKNGGDQEIFMFYLRSPVN